MFLCRILLSLSVGEDSPVPVFIFICIGEELRAGQRQVQSGQGQISVAKADQLERRSQMLVLVLHRLGDDLQVGQTHLLRFAVQHERGRDTEDTRGVADGDISGS